MTARSVHDSALADYNEPAVFRVRFRQSNQPGKVTFFRQSGSKMLEGPGSRLSPRKSEYERAGMNIDTMRRIDRQAGVPLCAIATLMVWAWEWVRRPAPRPLRRILFVELSEMGTTVLAQPAMRKAR